MSVNKTRLWEPLYAVNEVGEFSAFVLLQQLKCVSDYVLYIICICSCVYLRWLELRPTDLQLSL